MIPSEAVAFVKPTQHERWTAAHKLVQHADLRDYWSKLIADAMEATGGR